MSKAKEIIKKIIPQPLIAAIRDTRDGLGRMKYWPQATFHPWRRDSVQSGLLGYHRANPYTRPNPNRHTPAEAS